MKKVLAAALIAGSTISTAFAADLPSRKAPILAPPPPVFTWTGFYVGLNAGGTVSNSNAFTHTAVPGLCTAAVGGCTAVPNFSTTYSSLSSFVAAPGSNSGALLGAQAGYNWQFGTPFLLGIEADIQGVVSPSKSVAVVTSGINPNFPANPSTYSAVLNRRLDYLGTVRARIGYLVTPTFLLYATGGLAYGGVKSSTAEFVSLVATPPVFGGGQAGISKGMVGYTVGGGVEWMFMPSWSLKAEYLYYDLGRVTYATSMQPTIFGGATGIFGGTFGTTTFRQNGHVGRLGVNYHFWGPAAPVVARY